MAEKKLVNFLLSVKAKKWAAKVSQPCMMNSLGVIYMYFAATMQQINYKHKLANQNSR